MRPNALRLLCGFLLGLAALPANAQITVEPQSLSAMVEQYATETRTVTLTNDSAEALTFCLSFDRPLQRSAGTLRLADEAAAIAGAPCGPYGEVLHRIDRDDVDESGWLPFGLAMTPDGRLFMSSISLLHRTFELTLDLEYVRFFEHPFVDEVGLRDDTQGITFDPEGSVEGGSLWWLNLESSGNEDLRRALLLEGDLDGNATGRRIEIPVEHEGTAVWSTGLSYDAATGLFYYVGFLSDGNPTATNRLWAVNRDGVVPEGYPRPQTAYPGRTMGRGVDAHGGEEGGAEGVRIETAIQRAPPAYHFDRVVVLDRWGEGLGAELETPVPAEILGPESGGIQANPLRSRLDPNGVMYMTFRGFGNEWNGVVAVRPHPLPPSWLVVGSDAGAEAAGDGTLGPLLSVDFVIESVV